MVHGEPMWLFAPLSGFKTSLYEGGIKPPDFDQNTTIITISSNNASSNLIKSFVYVTDIMPTILDMAGVSHPSTYKGHDVHALMGKSIKPLLDGTVEIIHPTNEAISGEMFNNTSVRMGEWKGVHMSYDKTGVWKLFNLATDLGENTDLADQHLIFQETSNVQIHSRCKSSSNRTIFNAISTNNSKRYTNY